MADKFVSRISVTLAAGASTTVAHGLVVNGAAVTPQKIEADRLSGMQIDAADATNITVSNPGSTAATTIFLCTYLHSIDAVPGDTAPGWWWKGSTSVGGAIGFLAPNEYYVDSTLVDSAGLASLRMFSTVALAVAAAEALQTDDYVIRLREGQGHTWDGAGFSGTLNAVITTMGDKAGVLQLTVGGLTAGTSTLRFARLLLTHAGAWTSVTGHGLVFDNCRVISLTGFSFVAFASVEAYFCTFVGTRFLLVGALGAGFRHCSWTPGAGFPAGSNFITFQESVVSTFDKCDIVLDGAADITVFGRTANNPTLRLCGVSIDAENTGAATTTLFNSASLGVVLRNVQVTRRGAGLINFGSGTPSDVSGLVWQGKGPDDNLLPASTIRNDSTDTTGAPGAASTTTSGGVASFALGAASCVITNPYVVATSRILVSLQRIDGTLTQILTVVPGAGSFTVTGNAVAAAATPFTWQILPNA